MNTRLHQATAAYRRQTQCHLQLQCITNRNLCVQCANNEDTVGNIEYYDSYEARYLRRRNKV